VSKYNILLVDDNVQLLDVIGSALEDRGYHVTKASSGECATDVLIKRHFDLVMTDLNMDRINGFGVLKKSKEMRPDTPVMIMTGNSDAGVYDTAIRMGADDFMWKPFGLKEFWSRVANWVEKSEQKGSAREFSMMSSQEYQTNTRADIASGV